MPHTHTKFRGNPSVGSGKKIFERILSYLCMAAILVIRPRCHEQIFVPTIQGGSTYNLALICSAVSEKMMF